MTQRAGTLIDKTWLLTWSNYNLPLLPSRTVANSYPHWPWSGLCLHYWSLVQLHTGRRMEFDFPKVPVGLITLSWQKRELTCKQFSPHFSVPSPLGSSKRKSVCYLKRCPPTHERKMLFDTTEVLQANRCSLFISFVIIYDVIPLVTAHKTTRISRCEHANKAGRAAGRSIVWFWLNEKLRNTSEPFLVSFKDFDTQQRYFWMLGLMPEIDFTWTCVSVRQNFHQNHNMPVLQTAKARYRAWTAKSMPRRPRVKPVYHLPDRFVPSISNRNFGRNSLNWYCKKTFS